MPRNAAHELAPGVRRSSCQAPFVRADLPKFVRKELQLEPGDTQVADFSYQLNPKFSVLLQLVASGRLWSTLHYFASMEDVETIVHNARLAESLEALPKRAFFDRHGFVLVRHETALRGEDWGEAACSWWNEAKDAYHREVVGILREYFPEALSIDPGMLMLRGPSAAAYAQGVHQDLAFTDEDYAWSMGQEWKDKFSKPEVNGFMLLCFWRPTRPMQRPLQKMPLALCDPTTVKLGDVVPRLTFGEGAEQGIRELGLKADPGQRWYYYPEMTISEVLIFKQFQYFKRQAGRPELHTCFHTAFTDPTAPVGAEERRSAEYRVGLWF